MFAGEVVFPDAEDAPMGRPQGPVDEAVAGDVGGEFLFPEGRIAPGFGAVDRTAMPEAAVYKHRQPRFCKHKIGANFESAECRVQSAEFLFRTEGKGSF